VPRRPLRAAIVALLVGGGLAASAWTTMPTDASKILSTSSAAEKIAGGWLDSLLGFSHAMQPLLGFLAPSTWAIVLLTALSALSLPHLAAAVVLVFAATACLLDTVHVPAFRQLGMLMAMLVAVTWILRGRSASLPEGGGLQRISGRVLLFGIWPLLLALQAYKGLRAVKDEVELSRSSAPELADYLSTHGLRDAVLLGEPDYYLDSLPFYADNAIFIAREGRHGRRVSWTKTNRQELDLAGLLASAREVQRTCAGPVLLLIGPPVVLTAESGNIVHGYRNRFVWDAAQREAFLAATERLGSFPARPSRFTGDEAYVLYRLR
jgi:hypothetical protein